VIDFTGVDFTAILGKSNSVINQKHRAQIFHLRCLSSPILISLICILTTFPVYSADDAALTSEQIETNACPVSGNPQATKYFEVCDAETKHEEGVHLLNARLFFGLSAEVQEALQSGVPITLQLKIEILRERSYMWNESVASLNQKYRLHYHILSQQFILTNLNTKINSSYESSEEAISAISEVHELPIIDSKLLKESESYYGRVRVKLVISDLPSPLRLWAYLSSDWRLKSEWFQWQL